VAVDVIWVVRSPHRSLCGVKWSRRITKRRVLRATMSSFVIHAVASASHWSVARYFNNTKTSGSKLVHWMWLVANLSCLLEFLRYFQPLTSIWVFRSPAIAILWCPRQIPESFAPSHMFSAWSPHHWSEQYILQNGVQIFSLHALMDIHTNGNNMSRAPLPDGGIVLYDPTWKTLSTPLDMESLPSRCVGLIYRL